MEPSKVGYHSYSARENTRMQLYIYIRRYIHIDTLICIYVYIYVYSNHIQSHHSHLGVGAISFACPACLESLQTSKVWPFSKEVGLRLGIGNVQELPPQIGAQKMKNDSEWHSCKQWFWEVLIVSIRSWWWNVVTNSDQVFECWKDTW